MGDLSKIKDVWPDAAPVGLETYEEKLPYAPTRDKEAGLYCGQRQLPATTFEDKQEKHWWRYNAHRLRCEHDQESTSL